MIFLSVILPTYNPNLFRLDQTLEGLKKQTLAYEYWELIVIDNNSSFSLENKIDLKWHPHSKLILESRQGLTYARLKGFAESKGEIIVMIDDDCIPDINYLSASSQILLSDIKLGAIGGKSKPLFEATPPDWLTEFYQRLALRDLGNSVIIEQWQNTYPEASPIGIGMAIRKKALQSYIKKTTCDKNIITDRKGSSLSSGGDNDIVVEVLKSGWKTGYFPTLLLHHIIPKQRMSANYLAKLCNNSSHSWILLLESHDINPWKRISKWSVPIRTMKAWFTYKAYKSKVNYIKWRGACGIYDGLSNI